MRLGHAVKLSALAFQPFSSPLSEGLYSVAPPASVVVQSLNRV